MSSNVSSGSIWNSVSLPLQSKWSRETVTIITWARNLEKAIRTSMKVVVLSQSCFYFSLATDGEIYIDFKWAIQVVLLTYQILLNIACKSQIVFKWDTNILSKIGGWYLVVYISLKCLSYSRSCSHFVLVSPKYHRESVDSFHNKINYSLCHITNFSLSIMTSL